jgi:hypothetical protein
MHDDVVDHQIGYVDYIYRHAIESPPKERENKKKK